MPVYQASACANPNQARLIVGFARVLVQDVKRNPGGKVWVQVQCGIFNDGEIGDGNGNAGGDYGTLVDTPGMIQ